VNFQEQNQKQKKKKTEQKAKNGPRRKDMVDTWDLER
jgi:hypothetical protein